jgi:hypothetical protein
MQRLRALLGEPLRLGQAGLDVPLQSGLFERLPRDVVIIDLAAILALGAPPGLQASRGEVQRRIAPPLGNEVPVALPSHLQGVVVAKVPIQP